MIKITNLDLSSIFGTGYTTLSLYIRARVLVEHPNHHHVIFLHLILKHLLSTPKVPAVAIDIVSLPTDVPSGTLLTCLCESNDATARGHMDFVIHLVFFFIISVLNDLGNIREFLCAQLVVSDGGRLILNVFELFIESVGVNDQVIVPSYYCTIGWVSQPRFQMELYFLFSIKFNWDGC
jgi:hypothetical protein